MTFRIRRRHHLQCLCCMALFVPAGGSAAPAQILAQPPDSLAVLRQAVHDIQVLASDSLEGRGYLGEGHRKAANYVARRFRQIGLHPPVGDTAQLEHYFQPFAFPLHLITDAQLQLGNRSLRLGADFMPHPLSAAGSVAGKVVDVGHGTPQDWAANASRVAGSTVLVREGLPPGHQLPDSLMRRVASWAWQTDQAVRLGARALLFERAKLLGAFAPEAEPIPILEVRTSALPRRIRKASLQVLAQPGRYRSQNVVGVLVPPRVTQDSLVVVTAHYDHLGRIGSTVFPGANDNASGVAFLFALAERLRADTALRHPLVFVAMGAEETGLNGSLHYVRHVVPGSLRQVRFVLNFDLVGTGTDGLMAVAGQTYPALMRPLQALNDSLGTFPQIRTRPNAPNSDHYPFTQQGVPALFCYTMGGPGHYHDIYDRPDTLGLEAFFNLLRLTASYLRLQVDNPPANRQP